MREPKMQLQEALRRVAAFLNEVSSSEAMASVKINDEGRCYFSVGFLDRPPMSIEEFAQIVKEGEKDQA